MTTETKPVSASAQQLPPFPGEWFEAAAPVKKPRRMRQAASCEVPGCHRFAFVLIGTDLGWFGICYAHDLQASALAKDPPRRPLFAMR